MLASIIANLQNVEPQPQPHKPMVKIDRGGGGPSWPSYDIVDIIGALQSFREVPGEHPVARAARRHKHIGDHLEGVKQTREAREAAAFLAGATLAHQVAEDGKEEEIRARVEAELAKVLAAHDKRWEDTWWSAGTALVTPASASRITLGQAIGIGALVLGAGIAIGIALGKSKT